MAEVSSTEYQKHNVIEIDKIKTVYEDGEILYADNMNEVVDKENEIIDKLKGVSEDLSELETYVMNAYAYTKGWVGDIYTYFDTAYSYFTNAYISNLGRLDEHDIAYSYFTNAYISNLGRLDEHDIAYSYFTTAYISNRDRIEALEAKEVEVDPNNNSINITDPDTKKIANYTLNIVDGLLGLFKYIASYWGTCTINTQVATNTKTNTATGTNLSDIGNVEYGTAYVGSTLVANSLSKVSCIIYNGTTNIALTGVGIKYNNNWTYIYGHEATITDGVASYIDGETTKNYDYKNTTIKETVDIPVDIIPSAVKNSNSGGNCTNKKSFTTSSTTQRAKIWYHERGTDSVKENEITNYTSITWTACTGVYKKYAILESGAEFNTADWNNATWKGTVSDPSAIDYTLSDSTKYVWFAITYEIPNNMVVFSGTPLTVEHNSSWKITHYSDNTVYYVYRMPNRTDCKIKIKD